MARLSVPAWSSLTRNVAFDDHGIRPSSSMSPPSTSSRSSGLPGSGRITPSRVVVAGMPVQAGADVARRVERPAAQRAGGAAPLDGGAAPGGHGPGLSGGAVEAGQIALPLVTGEAGVAELRAGEAGVAEPRPGVVVLLLLVFSRLDPSRKCALTSTFANHIPGIRVAWY